MNKKLLLISLALMLTGCTKESGTLGVTKEAETQEANSVNTQENTQEDTQEDTQATGDPEAVQKLNDLFNNDSYHIAAYLKTKDYTGSDRNVTYEIKAVKEEKKMDSSVPYDLYHADENSYLAKLAQADGFSKEEVEGPYSSLQSHSGVYYDKEKGLWLTRLSAGFSPGTMEQWDAYPAEKSLYDIISSIPSGMTDVKMDGGNIKGKADVSIFGVGEWGESMPFEGEVDVEFTDGTMSAKADGFELYFEFLEPAEGYVMNDDAVIRFMEANDAMMETTGKSEFNFASYKPDDYVRWAKDHVGETDTNGVKFRFTFDHNLYNIDNVTFENIYIDPNVEYGDFEKLGDFNETVRRFNEYKYSVTGSEEDKKLTREKHYIGYQRTQGLPEWYYNFYWDEETIVE